jgi:ribonuclease BN (tRNA processing enzyme)
MKVTLWGTRGSLATPGPETTRYGGNTSCVEVRADDGSMLVLDAGTGIRRLGDAIADHASRVDLLLTHLHMDHIQGLGFFEPLFRPAIEVHLWGPSSTTQDLRTWLGRYLSPPLFPVRLRDLPRSRTCTMRCANAASRSAPSPCTPSSSATPVPPWAIASRPTAPRSPISRTTSRRSGMTRCRTIPTTSRGSGSPRTWIC